MTTTREEKRQLKNLGDVHWKIALEKGYYHDQLLYNKVLDRKVLTEEVLIECSNTRIKPQGIIFNVVLDREFFIHKAIRHVVQCFSSEKELIEFVKECWAYYEKTKQVSKLLPTKKTNLDSLRMMKKKEAIDIMRVLASELNINANEVYNSDKAS